MNSTAQS
jgi:hypothetical protein